MNDNGLFSECDAQVCLHYFFDIDPIRTDSFPMSRVNYYKKCYAKTKRIFSVWTNWKYLVRSNGNEWTDPN